MPGNGDYYGELLVTPAPRLWHQQLVGRLHVALARHLDAHPVGVVLSSPADISWGPDVLVQPDVFVVPNEQARTLDWTAVRDLLLVAEVLSPSSASQDRFIKRLRYQEARVPLYWIVEVWTPEDRFQAASRGAAMTTESQPWRLASMSAWPGSSR